MSVETIQTNYEVLEQLTHRFTKRAQVIQQVQSVVNRHVQTLAKTWEGVGAEAFQREMHQTVLPALHRLTRALEEGSITTHKIAQVVLVAEEEAARLFKGRAWVEIPQKEQVDERFGKMVSGESAIPAISPAQQNGSERDKYTDRALERAGIDPDEWDPSQGFEENQEIVKKVYDYYRDIFLENPDLMWAGMARVAGQQTFYPGFIQINELLRNADHPFAGYMLAPLSEETRASLRELERTFLDMQQQIFMDMAWQHEAYLDGGIVKMRTLAANGELTASELAAWEKIATGNPTLIAEGNRDLLRREQFDIIQDEYTYIREGIFPDLYRSADGYIIDAVLSFAATSPMPGGEPFSEIVDDGNLTNFSDRWQWIDGDMLPRWVDIAQNDPDLARELVNEPLNDSVTDAFAGTAWDIVRERAENVGEDVVIEVIETGVDIYLEGVEIIDDLLP